MNKYFVVFILIVFVFFSYSYHYNYNNMENNNILLLDYDRNDNHIINNKTNTQLTVIKNQNMQDYNMVDLFIIAMIIMLGIL